MFMMRPMILMKTRKLEADFARKGVYFDVLASLDGALVGVQTESNRVRSRYHPAERVE